jgi:V8-like Glu-specific endopeptidase
MMKGSFFRNIAYALSLVCLTTTAVTQAQPININDALSGSSGSSYSSKNNSIADIAEINHKAIGVVVIVDHDGERIPTGTAWAVKPGVFATNAHISDPAKDWISEGGTVQIQINNSARQIFTVTSAHTHPAYNQSTLSFDLGILKIEETNHHIWPIANSSELKAIKAGEEIAYVGFPMEKLLNDNINLDKPLASTQVGNIVAISDFNLIDSGFDNNYVIRHSIPAAGGASGSPIFTKSGKVIGLLNAGNIYMSIEVNHMGEVQRSRITNASMINFGVRVDALEDLL